MGTKVIINDLHIDALNLKERSVTKDGRKLREVTFNFKVKSEDSHEVTTTLYANDFTVKIPEEDLEFSAVIANYSTSITNLYHEGNVGDFYLELVEK